MNSRTANMILRALRRAPLAACLFAGCTCSDKTATVPPTQPPAVAAKPTAAPQAPAVAPPTEPPAPPSPPPPPDSPTPDTARQAVCERYGAVLTGKAQDATVMDDPEFKSLASGAPDLVTCGAVLSDSDEACKKLMPMEHGPTRMCSHMWATFHELRKYPNGRSFMFDEIDYQECRAIPSMPASVCDGIRDALRTGDANACTKAGDAESICRAYATLDKSLCKLKGKLAELEFALPDRKEGEPAKMKLKGAFEERCQSAVESRAFLAQGLKGLAESGSPRDKELAKAALGEDGACGALAQPVIDSCMHPAPAQPAAEGKPAGSEGVPGDQKEAPKADQPAGEAGQT